MIIVDYSTKKVLQGKLWQYNYGQVLRIQGGNLQKAQEIQFALEETGGDSLTRIGITQDGVTDVVIPDTMLENNDSEVDYPVYVFIYNRDETSGETVDKFVLNVLSRSKPEHTGGSDDGDAFGKVIEEVNSAKTQAVETVNATKSNAVKVVKTEGEKQTEAVQAKGQEVINSIPEDFPTQMATKLDKQQGTENAGKALVIGDDGNVVAGEPTQQIEVDKTLTQERQAADAKATGDKILQYAIKNTASQAVQSVNTAKTKGVNAINTAKTNAVKEVQTEGTTQTGNVTAEGAKQVQAVQAKGQQILDSITEIQVNNPATTYELQPNVQVVWNEVAELNLTLAPEKQNAINIYPFWFTSGATPTRVTLPATIILDGFVTKPNKKYCCQIEQNVMFWKEFDVV